MNIVVITETSGIEVFKSWTELKKYTSFDKKDFVKIGNDYILNCTDDTFEIIKDIKLLEHVAAKKMFTKNKMDFWDLIQLLTFLLVIMSLMN